MPDLKGDLGFKGDLKAQIVRAARPPRVRSLRLPFGRLAFSRDRGEGDLFSSMVITSHLRAIVRGPDGQIKEVRDLGSGLVTHAGVRLLSQDTAVSAGAAALNALKYHAWGIGTTAATALDTALQSAAAPTATTAVTGANANADASPNGTVTSSATITVGGSSLAITEWGLFNQATLAGATMWDHKVFLALNLNPGDQVTWNYTLTINSGG